MHPDAIKNAAEILGVVVASIAILAGVARGWEVVRTWWLKWSDDRAYRRGTRGIEGVVEPVPSGAQRTKKLEREMRGVKRELGEFRRELETFGGEIKSLGDGQLQTLRAIEKLFRNGGETNFPGDTLARIADRLGVLTPGHSGHYEDIETETTS